MGETELPDELPDEVERIRLYRSTDPDLPLDQWTLVADLPRNTTGFRENLSDQMGVRQYVYCQYVAKDGRLSKPSEIQAVMPTATGEQPPELIESEAIN